MRVEIPERMFSPDLRARTKTASSCCFDDAGKPPSRCSVSVAQPSAPVGVSEIENWLNGTAAAYTSAPRTGRPPHAETWKRNVRSLVERVTVDGDADWPSTSSRAGSEICDTS